jgi:hypothetical protein
MNHSWTSKDCSSPRLIDASMELFFAFPQRVEGSLRTSDEARRFAVLLIDAGVLIVALIIGAVKSRRRNTFLGLSGIFVVLVVALVGPPLNDVTDLP